MKKLIALIAVLSYVPFAHAAEGDWTHSGEFRLQYFNNQAQGFDKNAADANDQFFMQRTKLNTTVRAGEKMTFNVGLVHNADWGSNADQIPDSISERGNVADTASTNNVLTVNEAFMNWQVSDEATVKAGRITQTLGDGSVVSANEWEPVAKAFDGAGLIYDMEQVRLGAFGVTGARGYNTAGDFSNKIGAFYGIVADWKTLPAFLKMAHLHYIMVKRDRADYDTTTTVAGHVELPKEDAQRIGLTLAGDTAGVDYKFTYAMYTGETTTGAGAKTDIDADMMDAEVGYSMPAMMNLRVHAGYHTDSGDTAGGDNEQYNGFHYETYKNAGLMDVVGWGNLTYMRAGVSLAPVEDLTVGLEYLMFEKTEKGGAVNGVDGVTAVSAAGTDTDLGNEWDLVVTKKYTNNFAIQARYGMFEPGDAIATDDTFTQWYLESKLTF